MLRIHWPSFFISRNHIETCCWRIIHKASFFQENGVVIYWPYYCHGNVQFWINRRIMHSHVIMQYVYKLIECAKIRLIYSMPFYHLSHKKNANDVYGRMKWASLTICRLNWHIMFSLEIHRIIGSYYDLSLSFKTKKIDFF